MAPKEGGMNPCKYSKRTGRVRKEGAFIYDACSKGNGGEVLPRTQKEAQYCSTVRGVAFICAADM